MSIWLVLVVLHAFFALICFTTGFILLSPARAKRYPAAIKLFVVSLIGMIIFMVTATISHWNEITATERIVFSGLPLFAMYMLYRGIIAAKKLKGEGNPIEYIDDIGFSLISLFNGFIIVALIDLNASPLVVFTAAIAATFIGSKYIKAKKSKLQFNR